MLRIFGTYLTRVPPVKNNAVVVLQKEESPLGEVRRPAPGSGGEWGGRRVSKCVPGKAGVVTGSIGLEVTGDWSMFVTGVFLVAKVQTLRSACLL